MKKPTGGGDGGGGEGGEKCPQLAESQQTVLHSVDSSKELLHSLYKHLPLEPLYVQHELHEHEPNEHDLEHEVEEDCGVMWTTL